MTKIVYIMGAARSGSTILGVALGNCEGVFYAGELDAYLRRSGMPNSGEADVVAFWAKVADAAGFGEHYAHLRGDRCWRGLEHSAAVLKWHDWWRARPLRDAYDRFNRDIARAIAEVAAADTIVDSSHYPLRARRLRSLRDLDVHLVYLARDPQDVVRSFRRPKADQGTKSTVRANAYLSLTHALALVVYLTHPRRRRTFVRYEDFVASPELVVGRIQRLVGGVSRTVAGEPLLTRTPFQGNRLLRSREVTVRAPLEAGQRVSCFTALVQLPWRAAFFLVGGEQS